MKRIKRVYEYPRNVPRNLIMEFREAKHNERELSRRLDVNVGHISRLLKRGIEPKDEVIRLKLLFPKSRRKAKQKTVKRRSTEQPKFIKQWRHLPTVERHKVIRQYLEWKEKQND